MMRINILLFGLTMVCFQAIGQQTNPKISFTGTGRAWIDQDNIGGTMKTVSKDTIHPKQANTGYVLLDFGVNVKPSPNTQINAILRARNEFGGFYGSGATVRVRQVFLKGIIAKKVNYQVGDIDLNQTKYTLWNYDEEGQVNEASAFSIPRSVIHYENFYTKNNTWRVQGAQSDFSFGIGKAIERIKIDGSFSRLQTGTSGVQKFLGGGSINIKQSKWLSIGGNYMNTLEFAGLSATRSAFSNPVITGVVNIGLTHGDLKTSIGAEFGKSTLKYTNIAEAPEQRDGGFFEASAKAVHEPSNITLNVSYRNVSNTFFSPGAQSRRINYTGLNNLFPYIDYSNTARDKYIWDLSRDVNAYNRGITESLSSYTYYSLTLPYGNATPNRQGLTLDLNYVDKNNKAIDVFLTGAALSDIVGEGTLKQKQYLYLKMGANLYVNKFVGIENKMKVNFGIQSDNVSREGESYETVKINNNLIDAGIDIEVVKKFEVLLGYKYNYANGNSFNKIMDQYNRTYDYLSYSINLSQSMIGGGLKYNFSERVYVTLQDHYIIATNGLDNNSNLTINQLYMLFNMTF